MQPHSGTRSPYSSVGQPTPRVYDYDAPASEILRPHFTARRSRAGSNFGDPNGERCSAMVTPIATPEEALWRGGCQTAPGDLAGGALPGSGTGDGDVSRGCSSSSVASILRENLDAARLASTVPQREVNTSDSRVAKPSTLPLSRSPPFVLRSGLGVRRVADTYVYLNTDFPRDRKWGSQAVSPLFSPEVSSHGSALNSPLSYGNYFGGAGRRSGDGDAAKRHASTGGGRTVVRVPSTAGASSVEPSNRLPAADGRPSLGGLDASEPLGPNRAFAADVSSMAQLHAQGIAGRDPVHPEPRAEDCQKSSTRAAEPALWGLQRQRPRSVIGHSRSTGALSDLLNETPTQQCPHAGKRGLDGSEDAPNALTEQSPIDAERRFGRSVSLGPRNSGENHDRTGSASLSEGLVSSAKVATYHNVLYRDETAGGGASGQTWAAVPSRHGSTTAGEAPAISYAADCSSAAAPQLVGKEERVRRCHTVTAILRSARADNSHFASVSPSYISAHSRVSGGGQLPKIHNLSELIRERRGALLAPSPTRFRSRGVYALFGTFERSSQLAEFTGVFRLHRGILEGFVGHVLLRTGHLFPPEIDFQKFLFNPQDCHFNESLLSTSLVSWPLHTLFLASCFYVTACLNGYSDVLQLIQEQGGIFASGKGIFAAIAVAMSPTERDLADNVAKLLQASFAVGKVQAKKEASLQVHLKACSRRSFSLLLVNIPTMVLRLLVDEVNKVQYPTNAPPIIPLSRLEVTRIISSRSAIVSGHPLDLERLDMLLARYANATGVKIHKDFLPTTVPENSQYYNQVMHLQVLQEWDGIGFRIEFSDICAALYSPVNGHRITKDTPLMEFLATAVMFHPQDLTYSLQHLRAGDVLLDFSAHSLRLGHMIAWTRRKITVLVQPADHVEESILPSPRRSSHDAFVRATLGKCATINEILSDMNWHTPSGERAYARSMDLSFIDIGLLVGVEAHLQHCAPPSSTDVASARGASMSSKAFCHQSCASPSPLHRRASFSACRDVGIGGVPDLSVTSFPLSSPNHPSPRCSPSQSERQLQSQARSLPVGDASGAHHANGTGGGHGTPTHGPRAAAGERSPPATLGLLQSRYFFQDDLILLPSAVNSLVVNVFQVCPAIKYYEMQYQCVLTQAAVEFAGKLRHATGVAFPPYTLLVCPTVFALLELWDAYEFLRSLPSSSTESLVGWRQH